ncbi:DMSO/TMAO reductase YedYZ, heme-binding membrane subunit [Micromonospora pattaloongensis]|uniref:DMSO/TMAO reductase YedYZ, heme-binding membrane subunit n=1 Tax=Micromonospora pattaloongensis TaxID=405436 RepID=A0A1H3P058_9ACTN|nr:ferric reductase-like transmembrane domain-containing protein [Micromonospora pattaloongensis]SDY94522.1 DMSO/TMAO reductase YedYZ, heme-binding membrane subunit [Micromonospora pattaloongensis]
MREIEECMAGTKLNQRSAIPKTVTGVKARPSKMTLGVLTASVLTALWALSMLTPSGRIAYVFAYFFVDFYAGVFTLVSLSITVMAGLICTDRIVLKAPHRVLMQAVHRTTGTLAVTFLALHILTQVSLGRVGAADVLVPFLGGLYVGFGTLAAFLMTGVFWTGLIRSRFLGGKPWMWRALHSTAYASWPVALLHGLNAGRPPAAWVTASYFVCVGMVAVALLVRLSVNYGRRDVFATQTGAVTPAAKPAADPVATGTSRRRGGDVRMTVEPPSRYRDEPGPGDILAPWERAGDYRTREVASTRSGRYAVPAVPRQREEESPRWSEPELPPVAADAGRRGGRHSRDDDEQYDLVSPAPAYGAATVQLPPDDTPTLVDLASRRARRAEGAPPSSRSARRRPVADDVDAAYWANLRGEAR